jgi:hypothetical protein
MVNILRLTVAYLNATINVKPKTQNQRLEPTGITRLGETRGLTVKGPGLARQESAGRVFGRFWNRTNSFLRSKPGPLAGYPDPLLTLAVTLGRIKASYIHLLCHGLVVHCTFDPMKPGWEIEIIVIHIAPFFVIYSNLYSRILDRSSPLFNSGQ